MSIQKIDTLQAAVEAAKKTSPRDLQALRDQIDVMIKAQGAQAAYDTQRAQKMNSALANPDAPAVRQAIASLARLGLSAEAAADIAVLYQKLDERRWSTEERLRLKSMLHSIGVL
jgi:hypothetical protein